MTEPSPRPHVAIIGGGIAGLAAAYFLRESPVSVTVFEGSSRLGGKLRVSSVAGVAVDEGAEALLARRPEGTGLIHAVGLADQLETPGTTSARIWSRGTFRELPGRQFMGVPSDLGELARVGLLSGEGLTRARLDAELPPSPLDGDVSVASYVSARFGQELVDRLVDPLLGGVYAGRSEELSFEATLPALAAAARRHRSLADAAAGLLPPALSEPPAPSPPAARRPPPVFTTLSGGLGLLPAAVAAASGARVRTNCMIRAIKKLPNGWGLESGPASEPEFIEADAVILAVPASPASKLLSDVARGAAAALAEIRYASMAIVTLAYPQAAVGAAALTGSGYLVPAVDGRAVKAVTFSTVKWPHLLAQGNGHTARAGYGPGSARGYGPGSVAGYEPGRGGGNRPGNVTGQTRPDRDAMHIVRCSIGRIGEEAILQRDDADLAALAAAEFTAATGVTGPPAQTRVTRWGGSLPQYTVGHLDRVARIRAAVEAQPGLAVCGAAYDGLGIPACIASAHAAAAQVTAQLTALRR
ncbi:MAG TPA: protoporphyrinogen oxidase [Streptosporangiaceae bacterium]|nr:protoporphyrinogen oxidase [Streptosporangiaceae bacterium]